MVALLSPENLCIWLFRILGLITFVRGEQKMCFMTDIVTYYLFSAPSLLIFWLIIR